jgi:hypothetical protein
MAATCWLKAQGVRALYVFKSGLTVERDSWLRYLLTKNVVSMGSVLIEEAAP